MTQLHVLYLILRYGAGVDAGVGRAYGVGIFDYSKAFSRAFGEEGNGAVGLRTEAGSGLVTGSS